MSVCVYAGFAGDTDEGRFRSAGLFRMRNGGAWERLDAKFDQLPEVHTIVSDPERPGRVTNGTDSGIFRSEDYGDHWQSLPAPKPKLAVWSLLPHPSEKNSMFAGY